MFDQAVGASRRHKVPAFVLQLQAFDRSLEGLQEAGGQQLRVKAGTKRNPSTYFLCYTFGHELPGYR